MGAQKKQPDTESNLLMFPVRHAVADAVKQSDKQQRLEAEIVLLLKILEDEPDPLAQKNIRARLWRAVKTGKTE